MCVCMCVSVHVSLCEWVGDYMCGCMCVRNDVDDTEYDNKQQQLQQHQQQQHQQQQQGANLYSVEKKLGEPKSLKVLSFWKSSEIFFSHFNEFGNV